MTMGRALGHLKMQLSRVNFLQMLGAGFLLLTIQVWQVWGCGRYTIVGFAIGISALILASIISIRFQISPSRVQKNTILLLILELVSMLYLYVNFRDAKESIGRKKLLFLIYMLAIAAAVQFLQLVLTSRMPVFTKQKVLEIFLVGSLCILFGFLLNLEVFNTWTKWDSHDYFRAIEKLSARNIFSKGEDGLIVCSHKSPSFALWSLIFKGIPGISSLNAIYFSNMTLVSIDLFLFYLIFNELFQRKTILSNALFAITATVTPWIFGMVADINVEHLLVSGILLLLYSIFSGNSLLEIFSVFVVCGTKETGIVIAAVVIFTQMLFDLRDHFKGRARMTIQKTFYYIMSLTMGIAFLFGILTSEWMGGNAQAYLYPHISVDGAPFEKFGFNLQYILDVIRENFLGNFKWIFTTFILLALIRFLIINIGNDKRIFHTFVQRPVIFILISWCSLVLVMCAFPTFNNPRYYTSPATMLCILGIISFQYVMEGIQHIKIAKKVQYFPVIILSILLFIQSYITIDPVTLSINATMNTGKAKIAVLPQREINQVVPCLSNIAVYNRQDMYYMKALDKAYAAIDTESGGFQNVKILCSNEYVVRKLTQWSAFEIWGYGYSNAEPPMYAHWNREGGYRYLSYETPQFSIAPSYVGKDTDLTEILEKNEHIYYIEMPWWDTTIPELKEKYPETKLFYTVDYMGWVMKIYQVK